MHRTLHLHFLYWSARPPHGGAVRSPSNPSFIFQSSIFPSDCRFHCDLSFPLYPCTFFRFLIGYSGYFYEIQCILWTCGIWNGNGYSHFLSEKRIANLLIENQWRFIELNYWISSPNRMREKFLLILTNGTGMCVIRSNLRNYAFYDESAEVKEKGEKRRKENTVK